MCLPCARRRYRGLTQQSCGCDASEPQHVKITRLVEQYGRDYWEDNPPEKIKPCKGQIVIDAQQLTPTKLKAMRNSRLFASPHLEAGLNANDYRV